MTTLKTTPFSQLNGNIDLPLTHSAVGICTPFYQGQKMTAPVFAVFFRLSFRAALIRSFFVMAGLFGQPNGWPLLDAVVQTHSNPSPKDFQPLSGGYLTLIKELPQ